MSAAEAPCPVCEREGCPLRFEKSGYSVYRCTACAFSFVHPAPSESELMQIYRSSYFERGGKYETGDKSLDPNWKNDLRKLDLLARFEAEGALLDVGSARGGFLRAAQERGYAVRGVEPSEAAARYAVDELGLPVVNSDLPAAGLDAEAYDLVTLWDVIEHLRDPRSTLEEVHRVLKPGGHVALSTGNAASLSARVMRSRWHLLTPPQHLFFYEEKGLENLLSDHGLETVYSRHFGKRVTLGFVLFKAGETFLPAARPLFELARRLRLHRIELRVNLFDIMTLVARKA